MKKIGIIGLGMLGNAVALHLVNSGYEVTAYNRTKEKSLELKEKGATIVRITKRSGRKIRISNYNSKRCRCCKTDFI